MIRIPFTYELMISKFLLNLIKNVQQLLWTAVWTIAITARVGQTVSCLIYNQTILSVRTLQDEKLTH